MVTKLLERAIEEASKLPNEQQDEIATLILSELESDARWDAQFEASAGQLKRLADEALDEHRKGKSSPLDPDDL